jgi:cysteine desulfurase family protein
MAYFDNAATTFPKPESVYTYMDQFYRANGASAGRGNYEKAVSTNQLISDTRSRIQKILHCPAKQVVFTPTATIALNMVIQGMIQGEKETVYITPFEHNAVTRTLHYYELKNKAVVHQLRVDENLHYNLDSIKQQFEKQHPDIVIMSHASNVCGLIAPVEQISVLAKEYGATVVIDMSQTAGLITCNIGLETIDFAVFAGHKTLYGPTGISGFVMKPDAKLRPILFGGTGFESANQDMPESLPERYEMGTLNSVGIAGLNAALRWHEDTGIEAIRAQEQANRKRLLEMFSNYSFIHTVGINDSNEYVGVVSTLIDGISSDSCGSIFDRLGISVRTGLQCAPLAHKFLNTYPAGTVRFSVGYFTNEQDFDELNQALSYIEQNI